MIKRYLTSLVYGLSIGLFCSFSAMATVCFLPDGNCGGVNYGYTDGSGSTCTYKTRAEANLKKGECEEVQKQGFCFYLACSMSKSDCDKAAENAPNHDKCCVPCGNCWKVDDCSIPDIPTCKGAGYETEQTCKNQNLRFKPNGKFEKNGTACGTCENGTPPHPCSFWNTLSQTYMTEAACRKQGGIFHPGDDKDSDNNICGTCDHEPETCTPRDCSGYTYTTLSDLSNTASYEQCDNGCGTTTYRCKSGYTYSNGKCEYKDVDTCTYIYFEATGSNTCGTTGNLDKDNSCKRNTCCFVGLSGVESIDIGDGNNSVMPIYNKISNKSNSCVRNRTTYYETLCTGTPEGRCSKTFVPNGCVSNGYKHDYEVKGTRWGTCGCDTTSGQYDTWDACRKATGKGCTKATSASDSCYKTCESQGYFSTESACKENLPSGYKCLYPGSAGNANCFTRYKPGFAIRYAETPNRKWTCEPIAYGGANIYQTFRAWLETVITSNGHHHPGGKAETIDGHKYELSDDSERRYEAGTYYVCAARHYNGVGGIVHISKTVVQYTLGSYGASPATSVCFAGAGSSHNQGCQLSTYTGDGYYCREVTFKEGGLYLVAMYGDYVQPVETYGNRYECHNY